MANKDKKTKPHSTPQPDVNLRVTRKMSSNKPPIADEDDPQYFPSFGASVLDYDKMRKNNSILGIQN